ncbi:MAG: hypothetical protein QG641_1392, partial [Candidatus Poribacteria bacterium]|nr:hypothetical protein [Candidatus Poribacteria bacterium]
SAHTQLEKIDIVIMTKPRIIFGLYIINALYDIPIYAFCPLDSILKDPSNIDEFLAMKWNTILLQSELNLVVYFGNYNSSLFHLHLARAYKWLLHL